MTECYPGSVPDSRPMNSATDSGVDLDHKIDPDFGPVFLFFFHPERYSRMVHEPAAFYIQLDFSLGSMSDVTIQITDMTGNALLIEHYGNQNVGTYHKIIVVSRLSQGIYICNIMIGSERFEKKLIKLN